MASNAAVLNIYVSAQTGKAMADIKRVDSTLKSTAATADKSSNAIGGKFTKAMKVAGAAAAGGLAYGLYKSVKVASQFEKQMDAVGAVSGASAKQMRSLEQQALKTGQATFYSANETAKAQEELVKGGLSVKQVIGGALPAALTLAEAGQLDLATASETTVNVMKLFGLAGRDASKIADMLATAANKTTSDVGDFSMALKQGGSVAKLAGLSLNNTVTILEALAESGIKNSDAGTSMKTSLIQLLKPSEKQAKLARLLNIEWTTQAGTIKTAAGLSKELREATDGMTKSERAKTLATLAGTDGVRTLNALYDAGPAKLQALERANNKQGTAQEIARKRMGNFAGQVEQLRGSLETLGIKVGQLVIPSLGRLAAGATKVTNEVTKIFSDKTLSGPEKFKKAFGLVTDRILETVTDVLPKISEAAAEQAPKTASAFVKGFVNANVWAKLAAGGFLLAKFGGVGAFGKLGTKTGRAWSSAFLLAVLGTELAKQVKQIIEGHELDAPNSEKFSMYLQEYFKVDAAKIIAPNRVKITTALGSLVFNPQTEKVVRAQGDKLQRFVGRLPTQIITDFNRLQRLDAMFSKALSPLPGKAQRSTAQVNKSVLSNLDQLISKSGRKGDTFQHRLGSSFTGLAGTVRGAIENIGINVDAMLSKLGAAKASKFQLKKFTQSLPQLKPLERQTGGAIVPGVGSGDRVHTVLPAGSFILNKRATAAFGLAKGGMMPVALEPGERRFLPAEVAAIGARNLEAMNAVVPRFQQGGLLGKPQIEGPAGPLLTAGRGAVDKVYGAAQKFVEKQQPKGGVGGAAFGPKGIGSYMGLPMANWVIQALQYAASKGVAPQPTSGYRSHTQNVSEGRNYKSEHEGTQYPYGAVDFGGYTTGLAAKMAVVNTTRNFKYPLLAPIGFEDDGHASGTGHQLGGFIQMLMEGGFAGAGYTVKGIAATTQQMHTAREIMEAADKTGARHLPRVASMMAATQESNMGSAGNTFQLIEEFEGVSPSDRAYKQAIQWFTKGYYHGGGIGLSKKFSDPGDIAQEVEGSAHPDAYDPWKAEGQKWTDGWGGKGPASGKSEDVPAVYKGARTGSLNIPSSVPKSLPGINKELNRRQAEVDRYRAAAADARKRDKPKIGQAITENLRELEKRVRELDRAAAMARREKAKRVLTKAIRKGLGRLGAFDTQFAERERAFNLQGQLAEQIVALEPLMPDLPAKATDAQREAIEKGHVENLKRYISTQEEPAYQTLLQLAGDWRNTILGAQTTAAGDWQKRNALGGIEGHWEDKIIGTEREIDNNNNFIKAVAERVSVWRDKHGSKAFPDWLKDQVKEQHKLQARLPVLRFQENELRKALGEGRESFYPGKARVTRPAPPMPGSGSFEEALQNVQGIHWPEQHEKLISLPAMRAPGAFGGVIWDVQTTIADLGLKIRDAVSSVEGGGGTESADESESAAYWKEQARLANLRNLVFERQRPIVDAYESKLGFAGMFAKGGSIPAGMWGIAGERGPEPVIGPATVVSNSDAQRFLGGSTATTTPLDIRLVIEDDAIDKNKIKVIANGEVVKEGRRQGRAARSIGARKAGRLG